MSFCEPYVSCKIFYSRAISPQLESGNFIKKVLWVVGQEFMIALVTVDSIIVYNIAVSYTQPSYLFLLPTGKIRDCTFYCSQNGLIMYLISSSGHVYVQSLYDETLLVNGPFYVTNTLELNHGLISFVNGQVLGGGASIYYSHVMQLLLLSFMSGKVFVASVDQTGMKCKTITHLETQLLSKALNKSFQAIHMWTEPINHPGLIFASYINSSCSIVSFVFHAKNFKFQEIKLIHLKHKICDYVVINKQSAGNVSIMAIAEDGSVRIFYSNKYDDNFWLDGITNTTCVSFKSESPAKSQKTGKLFSV